MKLEFSRQFLKNTQISNLIKIRLVGAELLHADRRTDMTKLKVAFRSFANAPNTEHNEVLKVLVIKNFTVPSLDCRVILK
jgi:hypothetical protein